MNLPWLLRFSIIFITLLVIVMLTGCLGGGGFTRTPTPTPTPTRNPLQSPTPTPPPSQSPTPSPTPTPIVLPAQGTYVYLQSDSGDWVGAGKNYSYNPANAQIVVTVSGNHFSIRVTGNEDWWGDFTIPYPQLQTGNYPNATRYPFNSPASPGLNWSGEGRGSNNLSGWFSIDKLTNSNNSLSMIAIRFEQHSEYMTPALHGQIQWDASDGARPPGPINPPPTGLWQPAPGSTPATGNYVYLLSDPGDWVGQGQTYLLTPQNAQISVSATGGFLSISINPGSWNGNFQTMDSLSRFEPGFYGDLQRYPFHNPVKGGLSWSGQGRGSNTLTGWMVIDNVTYSGGVLTAIDFRFEQHSEGASPALHGKIHWTQ